jgi:hypothetical protein
MISLATFWSGGVWRNNAWSLSAVSERSNRRDEIPALNRHGIVRYIVYDPTILFMWPEDHGEYSRPRQNDRPSVQTTPSETYQVQMKIAEEQPRIGPTSNAIGPVVGAGSVPTNGKARLLTLYWDKIHFWIEYSVLGLDFLFLNWIFCVRSWLSWSIYMTKVEE